MIDVPDSVSTEATAINDAGQIVGSFEDINGVLLSFVYFNGVFTAINVPDSVFNEATGVNNAGDVLGDSQPGFFLLIDGAFSFFKAPIPGVPFSSTDVNGINDAGQIVGMFVDSGFISHGFVVRRGITVYYAGMDNEVQTTGINLF